MTKPRRRSGYRPGFDQMERRALLSGTGVNLPVNADYIPEAFWTDIQKSMGGWGLADRSKYWQIDKTIPTTEEGYALAPASASAKLDYYPDGAYQVSFAGTATLEFWGVGELAAPMVKGSDGITRGTVIVQAGSDPNAARTLGMTVLAADANDPWHDLHIWAPGAPTDGSRLYTSEFLASLQPFDYIRFLDWTGTNDSVVSKWSDRSRPDDFFKTGSQRSVSYEEAIQLANLSGKDMWLTIPALADDEFVTNLATLLRTELDPGLKVYVEYSNETWNTIFKAYPQVLAKAKADPRVLAGGNTSMIAQETALQTVRLGQIFRGVFGSDSSRVMPVFASWAAYPSHLTAGLQAIQRVYGDPRQYITSTAIAPYMPVDATLDRYSTNPSDLLTSMEQKLANVATTIQGNVQAAAAFGLPLDTYEGGQHYSFNYNYNAKRAALNDPRMYDLYRNYYQTFAALGGRQMTFYTLTSEFWGLKPQVDSPGSQRWDAVMSLLLQPGDADLDGNVDFADFQIVQANFNRTELWWQQGDFNHDRKVDAADLALLLKNLDAGSLTAAQAVEIAVALRPATTTATGPVEFSVSGQKALADATIASATVDGGSYVKNGVFNGGYGTGVMKLGGVSHAKGLGVSSSSTIVLPIDRLYTSFAAIIGVDDRVGANAGQATFQVVGDGRVLYTSPVMRAGVALPIEVDVAGVSSLSLIVSTPAGQNVKIPADWAQARLVAAQSAPRLTWTVTKDGATISTTSAESFIFVPAGNGEYTVSVRAVDASGAAAVRSAAIKVAEPTSQAQATFFESDPQTSGSWKGVYGFSGSVVADAYGSYPSYANVTLSGATVVSWSRATPDTRALQKLRYDSSNLRTATTWYGRQFTINVDLTDGETHLVSLYAVDWSGASRVQRIDVLDAATGEVLDSREISSFSDGRYLRWSVSGHVQFRVTKVAGYDAVIGGVFFDEVSPAYAGSDSDSKGAWKGEYGSEGYLMPDSSVGLPSFAQVSVPAGLLRSFGTSTTDPRFLQTAAGTTRQGSVWKNWTDFNIDVNLTDGKTHQVTLYALDWDDVGRIQRIDVVDVATGKVIDSRRISSFTDGVYLKWNVSGRVQFRIIKLAGPSTAISGVFIDPAPTTAPDPTPTPDPDPAPKPNPDPAPAPGVVRDATTKGDWTGAYGSGGSFVVNNPSTLPPSTSVAFRGGSSTIWTSSTTDVRALTTADGTKRQASTWAGSEFTIDVTLGDGQPRRVSLYMVDWYSNTRSQRIEVIDKATGRVIDVQELSKFNGGVYLTWEVAGSVQFRVSRLGLENAVVSGVFIDPASTTAPAPGPAPETAPGVVQDATTRGDWTGMYGGGGSFVVNNPSALPPSTSVAFGGGSSTIWTSNTTDVRALTTADGTKRQASTWAGSEFTIDVTLGDGQPRRVSLYMVDWYSNTRSQRIEVIDKATGRVIDVQELSKFNGGVYLTWEVAGSVQFRVSRLGLENAVVSGVFID
ncbi:NPCBM/NEW2 domain-containing protein [Planctomyces sp. SH-PL62]|uniref:NPCBM/NEW2 domain-containing protein n=1 Tax=Planctomyces sp. SH-PL62 TaxID=1636152 RepID=UPI00078E089F|nr:NPCBM/NEW2 domain-containing protein [Planctomyces sp. SH-PL62]AMV38939.1 NPCBM/NEW2 domain protein [Planctomyces sp. SH-PL62]